MAERRVEMRKFGAVLRFKELWFRGVPGTFCEYHKNQRDAIASLPARRGQVIDVYRLYRDCEILVAVYDANLKKIPLNVALSQEQINVAP